MTHAIRWTAEKITQRLALIEPLVYRRRAALPPFRYLALPDPAAEPLVAPALDDGGWTVIEPNSYWGKPGHGLHAAHDVSGAGGVAGGRAGRPASGPRRCARLQPAGGAGVR